MNDSTQAETTGTKGNRLMTALAGLRDWVDARLPVVAAWKKHMSQYYAPKNFNFWYFFGVLSLLVLHFPTATLSLPWLLLLLRRALVHACSWQLFVCFLDPLGPVH